MIQGVINTVSGQAERIRSFLHFTAADEGPLADYESWMPDFISGISSAVSDALAGLSGQQGNIVIPVYVGGTLWDELVVTAQRDVVRLGAVSIPVSFSVSAKWLKILTRFKQQEKITWDILIRGRWQ